MWLICLLLSVVGLILPALVHKLRRTFAKKKNQKNRLINMLLVGVFIASYFMFFPVHYTTSKVPVLMSVFNAMQIFTIGTEFNVISNAMMNCPDWLDTFYIVWSAILFVLAPVFTFGAVLSLFKNVFATFKYFCAFFKEVYIFSELNEKSLALARDIKKNHADAAIVFTDVFTKNEENEYELQNEANGMNAICFKNDILSPVLKRHSKKRNVSFFAIAFNETENLNHTLELIEMYRTREKTRIYVFSTNVESELLLTAVEKGTLKVKRINEVQSLVYRILYNQGDFLFKTAKPVENDIKEISVVVVGLGKHGTEMLKALSWYCQMDGYRVNITAFDKDKLAEKKFKALAPELMSKKYNGVQVDGEAYYNIKIHSGIDVETSSFAEKVKELDKTTYVFVALGDDELNIKTAVTLRMLYERVDCKPIIYAVLYNSQQKKALKGIKNFKEQAYNIGFIGDIDESYTENVIIDSLLEAEALKKHLRWGNAKEESFWAYEYNYRSSVASAIHMKARIDRHIPGADKPEKELTPEEKRIIEVLEHKRWNAYMRAEGYIYSGSPKADSRNDLAKMHHDLVDFDSLGEEEKEKDIRVGTA